MKPKIMTCPPLPEHLEIGQRYKRPCIRTTWQSIGPLWLPVIGSIHSDPEHVQADFPHVHVDYRFLTPETREELLKQMAEQHLIFKIHPVHVTPISSVWPEHLDAPMELTKEGLDTIPENTWMTIQPCAYVGPYPEYPEHLVHWLRQLSTAYANHTPSRRILPASRHGFIGNRPRPTWCHHLSATRLEMVSTHRKDHHAARATRQRCK